MRLEYLENGDGAEETWMTPHSASFDGPHIEARPVCVVRVLLSHHEVAQAGVAGHERMRDLLENAHAMLQSGALVRIDKELETSPGEFSIGRPSKKVHASATGEYAIDLMLWRVRGARKLDRLAFLEGMGGRLKTW
jgi:hypothetical protein